MMTTEEALLTVVEAAHEAGMHVNTIKYHARKGHIPGARKFGPALRGQWLIPRAGLRWFLSSQADDGRKAVGDP